MYYRTMRFLPSSVRVHKAAFTICSPDWSWSTVHPPLGWPGMILWHTLSGQAEVSSPGGPLVACRGRMLLLHVGEEDYEGWTTVAEEMALQWVHLTLDTPPQEPLPRSFEVEDPSFYEALIGRVIRSFRSPPGRGEVADAWVSAALTELTDPSAPARPSRGRQSAHHSAINQLCQEIEQRPGHRWTLEEMTERVGLSRTHLTRLFKRHRKCTPTGFVIRTRIAAAQHQLRLSNDSLARIADRLGYCDQFAFSKQFKRLTGLSPTDYRNTGQRTGPDP
jgi:AraC-like DNA-binding protein